MNARETAWRVFATELNSSTLEIKATEEKMPSYIVSPLGAKINRVLITGVLTEKENVAHILHSACDGTKRVERRIELAGNDLRNGGFSDAWRSIASLLV